MSSVILKDGIKVKGFLGSDRNVPLFIQFVEGQCIESCTSPESLRFGNNSENINTIIAKPHIYNEAPPKPYSRLGDEYRYKPLLRGINETPAKGDPVLLCKIGGKNYYLGPLNTENNVTKNADNRALPDINFNKERKLQKKTNTELSKESISFQGRNYSRMYKLFNDELDNPDGGWEETNRSPIENHGDMLFEGRYGNSLRIGNRFVNPHIFISNGRGDTNKVESLNDGSLISITSRGSITQHFGGYENNINQESVDSFELASDSVLDNTRTIANLVKSINNVDDSDEIMYQFGNVDGIEYQNQILIHSDRIIFNAKNDDIFLSSVKDIHIGAGRSLSISTNNDLIIESNRTFLGNPNPNNTEREMEPMILGNMMIEVMQDFLRVMDGAFVFVQGVPIKLTTFTQQALEIKGIQEKLTTILSKHHFIEPNR